MVKLALKETELSPRELAVTFIDTESYFVSEASTYRILKAHDLITSPAFIVIKAASEFKDKTTGINQLPLSSPQAATAGQRADRLHLHQGPWVGLVLSQHGPRRLQPLHRLHCPTGYCAAMSRKGWKLCTNMRAEDVTDTLDLALQASGCDQVHVIHKPRLLSPSRACNHAWEGNGQRVQLRLG